MAISVRNHGMGPSSSNVDDIESCRTLAYKNRNDQLTNKGRLTRSILLKFAQQRGWSLPWRSCRSGRTCDPKLACGSPGPSSRPGWRWSIRPWEKEYYNSTDLFAIQGQMKIWRYLMKNPNVWRHPTYWHSSAVLLDWSLQKKNFPLKSWTPTMAKMSRKRM